MTDLASAQLVQAPSEVNMVGEEGDEAQDSAFEKGFKYMEANAETKVIQESVLERNKQLK